MIVKDYLSLDDSTICAVITAPGVGAVSIIRVSGPKTLQIVRSICSFLPKKPESHKIYYGWLHEPMAASSDDNETIDPLKIDEVLVSFFAKDHSFTTEETVEISCHGGVHNSQKILQVLVEQGARLAKPGEFTFRAFMNGRIDLVQAEAVLEMIQSNSEGSRKLAQRQLEGETSNALVKLRDQITWVLANLEADIDFAQEDIQVASPVILEDRLNEVLKSLREILSTYQNGRTVKDGWNVVLIGEPNVGKSSLFNALVGEERAIVSPIAGTTRDYIEANFFIEGQKINLIDTAGLRESTDLIEQMGVERSKAKSKHADLILWVVDSTENLDNLISNAPPIIIDRLKSDPEKIFLIMNKSDLLDDDEKAVKIGLFEGFSYDFGMLSAQTKEGFSQLKEWIHSFVSNSSLEGVVLTNTRHFEGLKSAQDSLAKSLALVLKGSSPEFIAQELQASLQSLYEVLGETYDDEVMDRVFKEFCLGK